MIPALLYVVFALGTGLLAHAVASTRAIGRDNGGYWAVVLDRVCLWLGGPVLLISALWPLVREYLPGDPLWWMLIAAIGWLLVLGGSLVKIPRPEEGRWIAGTLEFSAHRYWLLWLAIPFLPVLIKAAGIWPAGSGIYAAHWGVVVNFVAALAGLALSASPMTPWSATAGAARREPPVSLAPWPEEMRKRGIAIRSLAQWEASPRPEASSGAAAAWQRTLAQAGSEGVSGPLCQAVARLVASAPIESSRAAVALGPDHCGQEEAVALAATELSRRYGEATLIVTSAPKPALARRLEGWLVRLGGERPVGLLDLASADASAQAGDLMLVDAETLSHSVLDWLRTGAQDFSEGSHPLLARIGLVVWWDAHEFSGVLAAHVWAVSRRLERLLKWRRGLPARALVLARRGRGSEPRSLAFLQYLLPYQWRKEDEVHLEAGFARSMVLHRLESPAPVEIARATVASLSSEWPTAAPEESVPPGARKALAESPASAAARIVDLRPPEVLSLREMICQGGRASKLPVPHHVAIAAADNPYVDWLLAQCPQDQDLGSSIHLLSAEGHPELVRRHLLLALREVPDTMSGLRSGFRWEEDLLRDALQQLSAENRLSRVPVRFLNPDGRLQRDSLYTNQNPGQAAVRSFRIIGGEPVELRDPNLRDGLLLEVDPRRLPIDAYPYRTFGSRGRCYRVREWPSAKPTRIACVPEQAEVRTWRYATPRISQVRRVSESLATRGLERYQAVVRYSEDVTDILERDAGGIYRDIGIDAVRTSFETQCLIVEFTGGFEWSALVSAAAALRHVVPVNTALEDDLLDTVPVSINGRPGLAFVDLYPGGIGLASSFQKTVWLVPFLFDRTARWLAAYQGQTGAAEKMLAQSPLVRTMGLQTVDIQGALRVLVSAGL